MRAPEPARNKLWFLLPSARERVWEGPLGDLQTPGHSWVMTGEGQPLSFLSWCLSSRRPRGPAEASSRQVGGSGSVPGLRLGGVGGLRGWPGEKGAPPLPRAGLEQTWNSDGKSGPSKDAGAEGGKTLTLRPSLRGGPRSLHSPSISAQDTEFAGAHGGLLVPGAGKSGPPGEAAPRVLGFRGETGICEACSHQRPGPDEERGVGAAPARSEPSPPPRLGREPGWGR